MRFNKFLEKLSEEWAPAPAKKISTQYYPNGYGFSITDISGGEGDYEIALLGPDKKVVNIPDFKKELEQVFGNADDAVRPLTAESPQEAVQEAIPYINKIQDLPKKN